MKALIAMTALLTAACTPMTEREREIREYQRVESQVLYFQFRNHCQANGGIILAKTTGRLRRDDLPGPRDDYRCL